MPNQEEIIKKVCEKCLFNTSNFSSHVVIFWLIMMMLKSRRKNHNYRVLRTAATSQGPRLANDWDKLSLRSALFNASLHTHTHNFTDNSTASRFRVEIFLTRCVYNRLCNNSARSACSTPNACYWFVPPYCVRVCLPRPSTHKKKTRPLSPAFFLLRCSYRRIKTKKKKRSSDVFINEWFELKSTMEKLSQWDSLFTYWIVDGQHTRY